MVQDFVHQQYGRYSVRFSTSFIRFGSDQGPKAPHLLLIGRWALMGLPLVIQI